jgi:hypothetical protein
MGNLPQPVPADGRRAADLRASDADREQTATVLQTAFAEGRLTMTELDERLAIVYAARTYAELTPVTRDLPVGAPIPTTRPPELAPPDTPAVPGDMAVLSAFSRRGPWVVGREFRGTAILGNGTIDLRQARFTAAETTIRVTSVLGTVEVLVPEDAEVHVNGFGLLGEFDHHGSGAGAPGAPRITITGIALLGNVEIRRPATTEEWLRRAGQRLQERLERRLDRRAARRTRARY